MFRRLFPFSVVVVMLASATHYSQAADLVGRFQSLSATNVNLTAEGVLDWAHWGLNSTNDFNHKSGVVQAITNFSLIGSGSVESLATNIVKFDWTDGAPALAATNVTTGLIVTGTANGFQITVPADTFLRRLKIYVGAFAAQGKLEASLSDFSSGDYIDSSVNSVFELADGVYTLVYAAGNDGQALTVKFTALTSYDPAGYVSLQAATLTTNIPPTVAITSPTNGSTNFFATQNVTITADAFDTDGNIAFVEFYVNGGFLSDTFTAPYSADWQNIPSGTNILEAFAMDNDFGEAYSLPITIVVQTNRPPTVTITNPVSDANFTAPAAITIDTVATDPEGSVAKVEFFQGASKIGESTNSPFSFVWSGVGKGIYSLTARVTDHGGAIGVSAPINIFVTTNGGTLVGATASVPQYSVVDLSAEGTNDWVHWGRLTELTVARKSGVTPQISNYTKVGGGDVFRFTDNYNGYAWSDGTPITSETNTTTGVYIVGVGNGFTLAAPASAESRTLKVYVGAYAARGRFVAYLSDLTAPIYLDTALMNGGNGPASVYTVNYASASPGQTLIVRFTAQEKFVFDGNVTLQAAVLNSGNAPPTVSIESPTNNTAFAAPATFSIEALASDPEGLLEKVEFFASTNKLGEATNSPYSITWSNVPAGIHTLTAKATDTAGLAFTSPAKTIFVTNAGGFLSASFQNFTNAVNLTDVGSVDWRHWGHSLPSSGNPSVRYINRKRNVPQLISNYTIVGSGDAARYTDNLVAYSWTDGTPTLTASSSTTGFYKNGLNQGFQITVPADTTQRHLKMFVGVFRAGGRFEARLSDSSAAPFIDTSTTGFNRAVGLYTIDYSAASSNQTLTVKYTADALFDEANGNVTLQAAALFTPAVAGAPNLNILRGFGTVSVFFPTQTGTGYGLEYTPSLTPTNWQVLTNIVGSGTDAIVVEPAYSNRWYRLKVMQ